MTHRSAVILSLSMLGTMASNAALAAGGRLFLATDGARLVRADGAGRVISDAVLSAGINAMTVVPEGVTLAGAPPGSVIAETHASSHGRHNIYRVDDPFGAATLVLIGSLEGEAGDLVFANGRLYGVGVEGSDIAVVSEFDLATLDRVSTVALGFRSTNLGGLAFDPEAGVFYITDGVEDVLYRWTPGAPAERIDDTSVRFGVQDLEFFGGVLYASLATDEGTVLSIVSLDTETAVFSTIAGTPHGSGNHTGLAVVSCGPDCNDDGKLNVNDFICFQNEWRKQTAYGDYDASGSYTVNDFIRFQAAFVKGCGY